MLGDEIDPEEFSESTGKKIFFCCGSCVKAFDGAAAYYIKAVFVSQKVYRGGNEETPLIKLNFSTNGYAPFTQNASSTRTQRQLSIRVRLFICGPRVPSLET